MNKVNDRGRRLVAMLAAALLVGLASQAAAQPAAPAPSGRTMTLQQVLDLAARQSPDLVIARTSVAASERRVKATKARRYPSVTVEANVFRWDKPLEFEFALPGMPPSTSAIRDQYTSTLTARAAQPLSGLLVLSKLVKAERAGLRAARADVDAARLDVVSHAATAFLAALQTRELRALAEQSIAELDAQLARAKALASVGSLDQVDVMRLDAARASAEQQLAAMEAAVRDADEGLLLILGLPLDTELSPVADFPDSLAPVALDPQQAAAAAETRPSLRAAEARAVQALGARDLAKANLFPNINAVVQFDHNEGQGTFALKNQWFIGVTLSWNVWDWGTNWHEMKAAGAQAEGARLAAVRARDRARLEVRSAVRAAQAAYKKLDAASRGAAAAEEAFRIQSVRFKEGALTTTDLLAAQVDVTRARGAQTLARFDYLSAVVALRRAMGQSPDLGSATRPEESK